MYTTFIVQCTMYTLDCGNVFYISLDNNIKYLLFENVSCHRLVLMHE